MALSQDEISALREELVRYLDQILDLTKFGVTSSMAAITVGLALEGEARIITPLLPILILVPSLSFVMIARRSTLRIATYLRHYAGENLHWEQRLRELRQKGGGQRQHPVWVSYHFGTTGMLLLAGWAGLLISGLALASAEQISFAGVGIFAASLLVWLFFTVSAWRLSKRLDTGQEFENELGELWKQIP